MNQVPLQYRQGEASQQLSNQDGSPSKPRTAGESGQNTASSEAVKVTQANAEEQPKEGSRRRFKEFKEASPAVFLSLILFHQARESQSAR